MCAPVSSDEVLEAVSNAEDVKGWKRRMISLLKFTDDSIEPSFEKMQYKVTDDIWITTEPAHAVGMRFAVKSGQKLISVSRLYKVFVVFFKRAILLSTVIFHLFFLTYIFIIRINSLL